jgi:hypothetical protein
MEAVRERPQVLDELAEPVALSENARTIIERRYLRKGSGQLPPAEAGGL